MKKLTEDSGLTPIDFDGYAYHIMQNKRWQDGGRTAKKDIYKSSGYFYGPFRTFNTAITNLNEYQILLVLRDPRDAVVSAYYSSRYSHGFPFTASGESIKKQMYKRKKRIQGETIDDHVIRMVNSTHIKKYYQYHEKLIGKPNVLFLKYEDMVVNFNVWLKSIIEFFRLDVSQKTLNEIIRSANFKVEKEDIYSNKRQVAPGEHRRKLRTETIKQMDETWKEILELLDYPINCNNPHLASDF